MYGIAKRTLELGAVDFPFLAAHCDGWPELKAKLEEMNWDEIIRKSGVSKN